IVRNLDATPAAIWDAWTNPDEAAQWLHPVGTSTPRETVQIDARVGGRYSYTMVNDATGETSPTGGVYREVVPLKKLVFTWGNPDDDVDESPVVTVTIDDLGELTRMTFDLRGAEGQRGDVFMYDGWDSALDVLVAHLGQHEMFG
ncbi:MAG: SRPBCC family protein, partial [Microbacterium sp.]